MVDDLLTLLGLGYSACGLVMLAVAAVGVPLLRVLNLVNFGASTTSVLAGGSGSDGSVLLVALAVVLLLACGGGFLGLGYAIVNRDKDVRARLAIIPACALMILVGFAAGMLLLPRWVALAVPVLVFAPAMILHGWEMLAQLAGPSEEPGGSGGTI